MVHYIFTRNDLPVGLAAAQVCHAAADSTAAWAETVTKSYLDDPVTVIVLGVKDEDALIEVGIMLESEGVDYVPILEPDMRGEPVTAIGVYPGFSHMLKPLFCGYDLYSGVRPY